MNKIGKCFALMFGLLLAFTLKAQAVNAATLDFDFTGYFYERFDQNGNNYSSWRLEDYRIDGETAYCIEPGIPEGNPMFPADWSATGISNEVKERVLLIGYYGTERNANTIAASGLPVTHVYKVHENQNDNIITLLDSGKITYVLSTSAKGRDPDSESVKFRRHAVEKDIECLTAIDTANALADCLESSYSEDNFSLVDIKNEINGLDILH